MSNIGPTEPERGLVKQFEQLLSVRDLDIRKLGGVARRWRQHARQLTSDLGNDLSFAERQLASRCAMLAMLLEHYECCVLSGQKISISDYTSMISTQKQLLIALTEPRQWRHSRDITSLGSLLRQDLERQREAQS